jgi:hypothetical protein
MMEPPDGTVAALGFIALGSTFHFEVKVRTDGDYGVAVESLTAPDGLVPFDRVDVEIWGVPADPSHDSSRGMSGDASGGDVCFPNRCNTPSAPPHPAPLAPVAFFTLPTTCIGPVETTLRATSWLGSADSASFLSHDNGVPTPAPIGNDGCSEVPFSPAVSVALTSSAPDSASGLDAQIDVPSDGLLAPGGVSQSHLDKSVVRLPAGVSVNPSGASGLSACSDERFGVRGYGFEMPAPVRFTNDDPFDGLGQECPESSRIGTVDVTTPLLDETLTGDVVLGTPMSTDPASGQMLRLFLVLRSKVRGLVVKVYGTSTADPQTGQLTATFDNNPQVPFDSLKLHLKGGQRGLLAMPQDCGEIETDATLSPWSGTAPVTSLTPIMVSGDCSLGFAPKLAAGMDNASARSSGLYSFTFSRQDGEQWVNGLVAQLPTGLLATVKDVPLCTSAQADAGACPAASKIGTVDGAAGSGAPFVLEQKGSAYLTEGYKGCAYGLAVKVPVVAGPFDGMTPETDLGSINVRQSVCVDPVTAQVTVTSDPLPTIWHGIPLRVRSITVLVDRDKFMLNPSDCSAKATGATFSSPGGAAASASSPFYASGCAALAFRPKLALRLSGKRQVTTGKHPGVRAVVTQAGASEAGIEQVVVRLPKSLALDPDNAQALCEFEDGTKPDLENHCPKGSIVGRARARTPLLRNDLVGNVYFVKNVRTDPNTGNLIRTLPMLIVALRGEIAVNLKGKSSTTKTGRLDNTFASVPDAPISQFNLNIRGGHSGILAVTRTRRAKINLCAGRQTAEVDMDGHNGKRHDTDVRMTTPCTRRQTKAARRLAKRAAAKARR